MKHRSMLAKVRAYLKLRRAMGYRLKIEGRMLLNFARYADQRGHRGDLTKDLALHWACLPQQAAPMYRARRLEVVRTFARHLAGEEPATEIPPRRMLGAAHVRRRPHLFDADQIHLLLGRSQSLSGRLRPHTWQTLIGLLACTGLRISEALALGMDEVDLEQGRLLVRQSKYHHARWIPLHPSAIRPLCDYQRHRQALFTSSDSFFVSDRNRPLAYSTVRSTFRSLTRDMVSNGAREHVRLHDLRHTFATRVLLRWQRSRQGANDRIVVLSRTSGTGGSVPPTGT